MAGWHLGASLDHATGTERENQGCETLPLHANEADSDMTVAAAAVNEIAPR